MAVSDFGVVKGKRLRVTRVGNCGRPLGGPAAQLTTKGFVTAKWSKVNKDAEDLEQTNAEGQICVADRTPPELKWFNVELVLCKVDINILSFLTDDPVVLDYANKPVGFRSAKSVKTTGGAALEVWAGTGADDCEIPEDDSALTAGASAEAFAYFLSPFLKEGTIGDIEIGASVMNLTITGITGAAPMWGKGPYDVVPIDADNTAGRLLEPMGMEHLHVQRTTIAPPAVTEGAVALTLPTPYFAAAA